MVIIGGARKERLFFLFCFPLSKFAAVLYCVVGWLVLSFFFLLLHFQCRIYRAFGLDWGGGWVLRMY